MRIYNRSKAGRPIRVVWTAEELGLEYELVTLSRAECSEAAHRARQPLGRVPALEDDDGLLFESAALCLHLADQHPEAGLIPALGTRNRALVYQWTFFAMTEVESDVLDMLRYRETAPAAADAGAERVRASLAVLDAALTGQDVLVGGRFTVADIVVSAVVSIAESFAGIPLEGRLAEYAAELAQRPARQRAAAALST